jgi:hypothetical protein
LLVVERSSNAAEFTAPQETTMTSDLIVDTSPPRTISTAVARWPLASVRMRLA